MSFPELVQIMTLPVLLAFCESGNWERVADASIAVGLYSLFVSDMGGAWLLPCDRRTALILLAIGPEGGAALARWVEAHGLDGVVGVGLVGVSAPWAERRVSTVREFWRSPHETITRLPIGPLEPLRGVADLSRFGITCECAIHGGGLPRREPCKTDGRVFPLRLVIACAPDDGVCAVCGGSGGVARTMYGSTASYVCSACSATGKALSSAAVAFEFLNQQGLWDDVNSLESREGGLVVVKYAPSADLDKHGLRAVIERLTR